MTFAIGTGGGHSGPGFGTNDAGVVIDFSRMRGVRVDPAAMTVKRKYDPGNLFRINQNIVP
jgi:Berberine and berberine like